MRHYIFTLILIAFMPFTAAASGNLYTLDPTQTKVKFATKMCEADILEGEFQDVTGTFYFDETAPEKSWVEVTIVPASTVYSRDFHRDDHIKTIIDGEKLLNIKDFPLITFKSTDVKVTGETTADVTGLLTLVGESHPMTLEITFHKDVGESMAGRQLAAFSAYGTFNRSDFNVLYGLDRIGIRRMGNEVMVLINTAGKLQSK